MTLGTLEILLPEILIEIFKKLNLKELIQLSLINTKIKTLVRTYPWDHLLIPLRPNNTKYIIATYYFQKYSFINSLIPSELLHILGNCNSLDLSLTLITNNELKALSSCHNLNLSFCSNITDDGIKHLTNCHTLNLSYCRNITRLGILLLKKCRNLYLFGFWYGSDTINVLQDYGCKVYGQYGRSLLKK